MDISPEQLWTAVGAIGATIASAAGLIWRSSRQDLERLSAKLDAAQTARIAHHDEELKAARDGTRELTAALTNSSNAIDGNSEALAKFEGVVARAETAALRTESAAQRAEEALSILRGLSHVPPPPTGEHPAPPAPGTPRKGRP